MIEITEEQARVIVAMCRQAPCPDAQAKLKVGALQAALEERLRQPKPADPPPATADSRSGL